MENALKESLWNQFGASIDMLKNAIGFCPEDVWNADKKFFYISYHVLIFLDYYLTVPPINFSSALPFTIAASERDIPEGAVDDIVPDRMYSKQELLDYLQSCREKCRALMEGLTDEKLNERWMEEENWGRKNYPLLEIILYNMRHVQHHAAQLNLLLRQKINAAPHWVSRASK
jgi:hypothetical protein